MPPTLLTIKYEHAFVISPLVIILTKSTEYVEKVAIICLQRFIYEKERISSKREEN